MAVDPTIPQRCQVLGLPVDACADVLAAAIALKAKGGGQLVTLNAEMTMAALTNPSLGVAIRQANLVIPDGAGVVWALRRQGIRVKRSPGIELADQLLVHSAQNHWRVALVGSSAEVMDSLKKSLPQRHQGLQLVLTIHGYQPAGLWPQLEQEILQLKPDLVLVALGIPRQETWINQLHQGQPGLWMGVGGSFDVWSGQKKRAPKWMGTLQIEWLYRLIQEPSRWRRMLALPQFALAVISGNPPKPAKQKQAKEKIKG
jgi:N-acetylglucosaminyldiphosphoundecaprenol N-acetyl-beta-D-mannosaminyltransferase